jgi:hypothetical protein
MKTSFKQLERLGFDVEKQEDYTLASLSCPHDVMTITRDGHGDYRLTIEEYYVGKPLNTLIAVSSVAEALFGKQLDV